MNSIGKMFSGISSIFEFNKATLSGALDVIVVENEYGEMIGNPFRVRFGKLKVLKSHSEMVRITVNGNLTEITMKLSHSGEGYFSRFDEFSPVREEYKCSSEGSSPYLNENLHCKPEQILPKRGDDCEDLVAGDDENDDKEISVEMSLCGHLWETEQDQLKEKLFKNYLVKFEEFQNNPWEVINHPDLLVKMDNKVYAKEAALPIILSLIVYKKNLDSPAKDLVQSTENKARRSQFCLNSDQLRSLGLKEGKNEVTYEVFSALQGVQKLNGWIFLWKADSKIVISDIDGTITKSDVLGHIFTMVGKDWSHLGVTKLYDLISKNGYKIMYLSSRAIGQANFTRDYLFSLNQEGVTLPDGPLIVSPDRLFKSFFREVIEKQPQRFKANALSEIAGLFPLESSPFYAGFGNKDTDAIAYRTAGVALDKIFIINPKGNIFVFNQNVFLDSYPQMTEIANEIFPPLHSFYS